MLPLPLLLSSVAFAVGVAEVPNPSLDGRFVSDVAGVIDPDTEALLELQLARLETDTSAEVAVVTVDSVPGTPKAFATQLFNRWGIGKAETNNGVLVLLVMDSRRLEMETGDGLQEVLPSAWLLDIQGEFMVPAFREGDFGGGIAAGVSQVAAQLRDPGAVSTGAVGAGPMAYAPAAGGGLGALVLGGLGMGWHRRRRRTCFDHPQPVRMEMLHEADEDAFLSDGQQAEETVGSVEHEVWVCPTCQNTRVLSSNKWFSGFGACPGCGNRTGTKTSTTITAATTSSSGLARVHASCAHCAYENTFTRVIPQVSTSSSSSSSGGSSFGGGSSSGGGAGSSW